MSQKLLPSAFNDVVTPPSSVQRRKGRPMIVDISINDQGEQIYQVHNSTRGKRRRQEHDDADDLDRPSKRMTPVRSILGTISPNTLNQDKRTIDPSKGSTLNGSPSTRKADEANIWSEDVEAAFEEALRMIPKNGLTKIKVSGKSCGRNELISDYILQKTGKLRTRKQVSSHIQVIKNLKKKPELIELINNGPSDAESIKKFDEVFTEIFFQKSLGSNGTIQPPSRSQSPVDTPKRGSPRRSTSRQSSRRSPKRSAPVGKRQPQKKTQRPSRIPLSYKPVSCYLKTFEMVHADQYEPLNSQIYTKLSPKQGQALRLKPDASVQTRFPNLNEYFQPDLKPDQQIPILHNLVNFSLPANDRQLGGAHETALQLGGAHETALEVEMKGVPQEESEFGCMTTIYSFGNEVVELVEDCVVEKRTASRMGAGDLVDYVVKLPFAKEFWVAFLNSIENNANNRDDPAKAESQKTIAVKGVTMKQVVFHKEDEYGFEKGDIKTVVLWEFTRAVETCETTSRRLFLPNTSSNTAMDVPMISKLAEPVHTEPSLNNQHQISHIQHHQHQLHQLHHQHQHHPHMPPQLEIKCDVPHHVPHMITPTLEDDLEEDVASSANSTLQFDDLEQHEIVPISHHQNFRTNSFPDMYVHHQQNQQNMHLRRMMSEPTLWSGPQQTPVQVPENGFNTDEFQGFHTYTTDTASLSMLNPGYMHLEHPQETTPGEVFTHW